MLTSISSVPSGSKVQIAPSLLSANFAALGEEIRAMTSAGADRFHLDIMDGQFVPNLTFGAPVVKAIRSYTNLPFDAHLMVKDPANLIPALVEAGVASITIHPEADPHFHRTLMAIKALGVQAGVSLNPGTPADMLDYVWDVLDIVLIMSVNPGFGGQSFLPSQLDKVEYIKGEREKRQHHLQIQIDGGITPDTAPLAIKAGCNVLVAGTAAFKGGVGSYQTNLQCLRGQS